MTDKYAVIGNPIAHSKSPLIHHMFAEQTGQDISYEAILAPLDGFAATVERLRNEGYKGCNVTVPFKFEALQLATCVEPRAKIAKAVNTLKFANNEIIGGNTDGIGLTDDLQFNLKIDLKNKRVLLVGAGGAASGVVHSLASLSAIVTIVNRNMEKAQLLATPRSPFPASDSGRIDALGYADLVDQQFDIIINATSTGLSDEMPNIPKSIFEHALLAYDMMYGRETSFMKFAREHGAAVVSDGLGMLVEQAAESFFIWRNMHPDSQAVLKKLRAELPIA
ncbi:MAG: shikimate dehydrogenase [Candidatus Nitrotoga sp.]